MDFWLRLKEKIKQENTTQEWVALQSGIKVSTFRGWITKKVLPDVTQAISIAKALNTSVEYLVLGYELKTGLSDDAVEVLRLYRGLPADLRSVAMVQLRALAGASAPKSASDFFGSKQGAG